jgi:hypothetical protein
MNLQILWEILFQYGIPVLIAFFAWLQRKLEKPVVEHHAAESVVKYLKSQAHTQAAKITLQQQFEEFLQANPQIKPRKRKK